MAEYTSVTATKKDPNEIHLRNVDLNLLTVFDAVMQMQNVTRAAQILGMSQPAVSNAVSRLKLMFNDELFVRYGRGIQPTARAHQLFGPVRQALQLVYNELPGVGFEPDNSDRIFSLSICSPLDIRLAAKIVEQVKQNTPNLGVTIRSYLHDNIEHQLRYQETEFVISYTQLERMDFHHYPLFNDELVLAVSNHHPRIENSISEQQLYEEHHAVVSLDNICSFSVPYYDGGERLRSVVYQGTDLNSVLHIVSQTYLVAIAPKWLVEHYNEQLAIKAVSLPWDKVSRPCYLIWHESTTKDKGHQWMKSLLSQLSSR
ncbi:transcriptional regulator LeuO [Photorhabdus bodei]|uniref:Transcriptional regulator LeuO n=1 Tax=Photorhabdus bodei TaxID=2029681 RepID=A0A329X9J6_9GAMM|nr:transcriptional regulator LeuO [Photorhabdus bodei]NDL01171.1 transcriptional regulator LeuO [Photorhabdus bodei]NDL05463.1 transcriptional regulator LeuO [Photorhabdus bodei]NDL09685.1 transcriptional regulator LeuO [Photorhabdus bodei]RAX12660.1 transcriptional regulator LeuO [Photorhabdus bodei]